VDLLTDPTFVRAVIASMVAIIFGFGWGAVLVLHRQEGNPTPPAPLWVNIVFMLGITFLQLGILARQIMEPTEPLALSSYLIWGGEAALTIGTVALLRSFTRREE
jgi:hypothetical protein